MAEILEQGYIQVYTGDGKGKTTASLGVALRVLGNNGKVFFAQFIKGRPSSEFSALSLFEKNFTHKMFGSGRFIKKQPQEDEIKQAENGLKECCNALSSGKYDLVVMDELNGALGCGILQIDEVTAALKMRSSHTEIIITGREAPPELIAMADLVSEIQPVKHYFENGVNARKGVEY